MDLLEMLNQIFEVCVIPLLGILTYYLVCFIKAKGDQISENMKDERAKKYAQMIKETIIDCVIATNQTYVDSLKAQGKFDAEAQKAAFKLSYDAVMNMLSEELQEYIAEVYGDVSDYITSKIEAQVKLNK